MPQTKLIVGLLLAVLATTSIVSSSDARVPTLDPARGVMTMAPLLKRVTPAVVSVSVQTRVRGADNPLLRDPFFRRFFGYPDAPIERRAMSAGSGVIVDSGQGHVLTNHHVIQNASAVVIVLQDGRQLPAKLIGSDPDSDLAVLQIKAKGLKALDLADSDQLLVGDIVFAIGNPFGLGQTVTSGIVSALGRDIGVHGYEGFIQTDAAINPGNSGGALVNSRGELIGINTAIIGPAGGNVGIGFAVPANMARAVMDQLIRYGQVRRGRMGVLIQDLTPDLAQALELGATQGALISRIERGSAADEAGLQPGDVIVSIDGTPISDASELRNRIGRLERGQNLNLTVMRKGRSRTVRLRLH